MQILFFYFVHTFPKNLTRALNAKKKEKMQHYITLTIKDFSKSNLRGTQRSKSWSRSLKSKEKERRKVFFILKSNENKKYIFSCNHEQCAKKIKVQ
jgi:hypothetical protein